MKTTVWFEKIHPKLKQVFGMGFFYSVVRSGQLDWLFLRYPYCNFTEENK